MGYFYSEDRSGYQTLHVGRIVSASIAAVVAVIALFMLISSITIIRAGERGIVLSWGAFDGQIMDQGLHFRTPIKEKVVRMNVQTRVIAFEANGEYSGLAAASKDLQDVSISIVANYHVDPAKVGQIFQDYGTSYEDNVLSPIVRETVKSLSSQYTAEELVTKRTDFSDKLDSLLTDRFAEKSAIFERVNVTNFQFSKSFNDAIEAKVTAQQNAQAAQNKLEQVKAEAQQTIETAKADAEAIAIQAKAVNAQGGADYVKLKWIEKWNGQMPVTQLGGATPLIQIPQ